MDNKISSYFYHLLNYGGFSFHNGNILVWGDPDIFFTPNAFYNLKVNLEKKLGKEGKDFFYCLGHTAGKNASIVLIKKFGFNVKDLDKFVNGATQDGYGYFELIKRPEENKPIELIFKGTNMTLPKYVKDDKLKKNIDSYSAGIFAGGTSPLFNVNFKCIEKKCVSAGDECCIFYEKEVSREQEFPLLEKAGYNFKELNKKILNQYMKRKIKTKFFEKKDVKFGDGGVVLRKVRGMFFFASLWAVLNVICDKLIKNYNLILEESIKDMFDFIENNPKLLLKDNLINIFKKIEIYGLGKFNIIVLRKNQIRISNENNPLPIEHRNIFGLSKKPVCNLSVVFLKKIFSGLTGKKVEVTEISCMGQGKNKCIFDIKLI